MQRKLSAISALTALCENGQFARIAQNYAVRVSEFVRKQLAGFTALVLVSPSQRARGFGKDVVRDKNIVVGVLAVPTGAAQKVRRRPGRRGRADHLQLPGRPARRAERYHRAHVEPRPWNCCMPCTSTSPKVDELGSRRRRNQVHVVGECRSA
jgi:hypothetical protein